MAVGSPPTVRRRQLGRELRRLREESGLLAEELADRLRCSASRISRIETARIRIAPGTVHEILDALSIDGPDRSRLVGLAREAEEPGWWQAYGDALPYEYATYIALESEASSLKVFEPIVMHGLLQTEDYARATIRLDARQRRPSEVEALVAARLARQTVLTKRNPVQLHVVLDESVLRRVIGSREILRSQLKRLVELTQLRNVTIQVLPFESGDLLAFFTGAVIVMEFPDPNHGPVMYLENVAGDLYVERPETIREYLSTFDELAAKALSPEESAKMILSLSLG
jgi:transcriptional regulator with XRE-family HTH domain